MKCRTDRGPGRPTTDDHAHRQGSREGQRVHVRPDGRRRHRRPSCRRARWRLLGLPVPPRVRRGARRGHHRRGPGHPATRRRAEHPLRARLHRRLRRGPPGRRLQGGESERHRGLRLRLVLHGRRRRRGLRRLRPRRRCALAGALLVCIPLTVACGRDPSLEQRAQPADGSGELSIGISEANPSFFWSADARPDLPAPFGMFRNRLVSMKPRYYRLFLDWASYRPGATLDLAGQKSGCIRVVPPCAPYAGVREQLEAVASAQRQYGGFEVFLVPYATPAALAAAPAGCEPNGTPPAARMVRDVDRYREFIRAVLALARDVGVDIRYWSPWNEPNHPAFLSPQRAGCDTSSPVLSPALYSRLARALKQELDAAPGRRLGDRVRRRPAARCRVRGEDLGPARLRGPPGPDPPRQRHRGRRRPRRERR